MIKITPSGIVTAGAVVGALLVFIRYFPQLHHWYLTQEKQDKAIKQIKKEQTLIVYAMSACLDGLQQLGANSSVTAAKDKLDKHINKQAHDQEEENDI